MKKVMILALLVLAGSVQATSLTWVGGLLGNPTDEWAVGSSNQWVDSALTPFPTPTVGDYAIVVGETYGPYNLLPFPVIRTDVGTVDNLGVSLHSGYIAELTIETGGRLSVSPGTTTIAGDASGTGGSVGTLNINGGKLVTTHLIVGANTGNAQINVNSGTLHTGVLDSIGINGNIDMEIGAWFHINGDITSSLPGLIIDGKLTSSDDDGTTELVWDYGQTIAGLTTVKAVAVPEPATIAMFGIGGLISLIRKRK